MIRATVNKILYQGRLEWAAIAFQAGNIGELALGGYHGDWRELTGSGIFILASELLRRSGASYEKAKKEFGRAADDLLKRSNKLFTIASYISIPGMALTDCNELSKIRLHDIANSGLLTPGTGTAVGLFAVTIGYGYFGAQGHQLSESWKNAENPITRWTLGRPRFMAASLGAVGLVPMIHDLVRDWKIGLASVLTSFLTGEFLVAISKPDRPSLSSENGPRSLQHGPET
jgi:hypothetical protein